MLYIPYSHRNTLSVVPEELDSAVLANNLFICLVEYQDILVNRRTISLG